MLRFSALCGPNEQKFGELLTWPKVMSPPKFLPNLSTDGQDNATFEAKNTNPHALIHKPAHSWFLGVQKVTMRSEYTGQSGTEWALIWHIL